MHSKSMTRLRDSKLFIYICAFLIPFVMMQVFWAVCGISPYGTHSILTGDMDVEFVNFYAYFINTLKSDNDWSYMLAKTLGGDFPGLAAFQLHDPLLFLLLFFPGDRIALGIEFIFTLQVSIAGLSASVLLNGRYKKSLMSLLFSTGYAFSSFFFGYLVLTIYFGALAILPLVLYFFLEYIDEKRSFIPFVITTSLYIYINYHMGFMLVIFLAVLYVSRIIENKNAIKRFVPLLMSGVTILLIDGFFLVRTGLSLLGEKTTEGADYGFYRRFPLDQLFAGMFSGCARNDLRPLIYCSVAAFFFAVCYFVSGKFSVREKTANAFIIAVIAVSMWINAIDAVWHGFNNPEGFWWRYAYFISITTVVIGYRGFTALVTENEETGRKKTLLISVVVIFLYMAWLVVSKNAYMDRQRLAVNFVLVVVTALATVMMTGSAVRKNACFLIILTVSVAEMIYSSRLAYLCFNSDSGGLPLMSKFEEDYETINEAVSYIKSEDKGFYRIEKDFDRAINDPALFDYIGLSHDSSCEKDEVLDWLVNFGFCKTVYFTYYNGGSTAFVDDLFGIKYYISRFDSVEKPFERMSYRGKYSVYKNDDALPMAYIAPKGLKDTDLSEGNTFEKQNKIASLWNEKPIFIKAGSKESLSGAEETSENRYEKTGNEGYIVYDISITEEKPLYFYFYAPGRQNGEVFVNGQSWDVYFTVNHWNVLCAGTYKPGTDVEIKMQIKDDALEITEACFYYEDPDALKAWGESAKKLNGSIGEVKKITSSNLSFETAADDEQTVIVSIPYDPAWAVKCDGTDLAVAPAMGELMSFQVPGGNHVIEMKYTPRGTVIGIILSAIGVMMFAFAVFTNFRQMKSQGGVKNC